MNALLASLMVLPLAGTPVPDQEGNTFSHVAIQITGNRLSASGGEHGSVFFQVRPMTVGRTAEWVLWKMEDQCGFSVGPGVRYDARALMGWRLKVTPLDVNGDAVRFRVEWAWETHRGKSLQAQQSHVEVTLRPGQSMPLDLVRLQPGDSPRGCDMIGGTVAASVVHLPDSSQDRRLLATDVWLVDRAPDGRERIQQLSLRGRFHEPQQFYFEDLTDANVRLDIFGELVARPKPDHIEIELTTRRRFTNATGGVQRPAEISSILRVKPDDVAAIELPALTDKASGAFRGRAISLRVRSRQIRGDGAAGRTASVTARRDEPRYHVTGNVKSPGTYPWRDGTTVADGIAAAGGYTDRAAVSRVFVVRKENGKEIRITVQKSDLLKPDDAIVVPNRRW